jgi:hypothetical protein
MPSANRQTSKAKKKSAPNQGALFFTVKFSPIP